LGASNRSCSDSHSTKMASAAGSALLLLNFAHQAFGDSSCVPSPVVVPVANVTLSNGKKSRGLSLSIGTPPQQFAVIPQWYGTLLHRRGGLRAATAVTDEKEPMHR